MTKSKQPQYRFDGFEGEWEEKKLGELASEIGTGKSSTLSDAITGEKYSILGSTSIIGYSKTYDYCGDFILTARVGANAGNLYKYSGKVKISDNTVFIKSDYINFLYHFLHRFDIKKLSFGTGQPLIKSSELRNILISTPSLPEQEAIGELFQTVDQLIQLQRQKLATLKEQKQTFLRKMFPAQGQKVPEIRLQGFEGEWEEKKLGEISRMFSGGTPNVGIPEYYNGNIPFIRSAEINSDQTELSITDKGLSNSSAKLVEKNTLLYALYGATSGEVGLSRISGAINQAILAIIPEKKYSSLFIKNWLYKQKSSIIEKYLQGGQGNLSGSIVKELTIYFPSLSEQEAIGNFFQTLDQQMSQIEDKLTELKALKQTLLNRLFV
ncbi:TPA: restriction endonuclease subunit S [Streptococcus pyogenes]|uniref:Restriction endonuclease subunit S n=1 Tax=Streptococcus pyogenes TaxID=1314 RepID=A0A5S4TFE0_STRPY|nr:restriction endonuclease subunit S [Streptococcus pyogenes]HER4687449.1 restriction endonuclease subunit S [Streptococcus pyogenes NGAS364]HER4777744.1 restriction endonuclease subunit S [Streptococcus pyogenes NGAS169]ESU94436.1 type I restriction modification DNA specificity domain protein [Streptococcus pyogenes GA19702]QAX70001.1 restriction endonuclease subunit S [Streptococcus pyogenes]TYK95250.1 restriction endonuclease subunit S [Streptococcus pyogenes]